MPHVHVQPTSSYRDPTWKIWKHFSPQTALVEPTQCFVWHEDFNHVGAPLTNTTSEAFGMSCFLSDGGLIADSGIANTSAISATSNDDNEAVVLASATAPIRITKNSGRKVAFECRVRFDSITNTKNGVFLGLFEALVPTAISHIEDDGTLPDKNFIGFHRLEGDGDAVDFIYGADGQTQVSFADADTIAVDTWYKYGFYFDGATSLTVWIDSEDYTTATLTSSALSAATFPSDVNLGVALVLHKAATGTAEGTNYLDWVRFGYTFASAD